MIRLTAIGWLYRNLAKRIFFRFDPEKVHDFVSWWGGVLGQFWLTRGLVKLSFRFSDPRLVQHIAGIEFQNPVGLSAGFDKNAKLIRILGDVGFGFAEIGSVTWGSYKGNPKPRLFRLPKSKALVVYYGLMNDGVVNIVNRIQKWKQHNMVLGMSVAKTNCQQTADQQAGIDDYADCLQYLIQSNVGDYYTINISCPNTFGGEPFTTPESLDALLTRLDQLESPKPVFLKMPVNLTESEYNALIDVAVNHQVTGVIIGNLTKVRDPQLIKDDIPAHVKGGISGMPTKQLSDELIEHTYRKYGHQLTIIGVGGIFSGADAYTKICKGASLVQLITGMVYEGPQLIGQINHDLVDLLHRDGFTNISQAVGSRVRD